MPKKICLNKKQLQAINLPYDQNALVLAGAGSGKTMVLTHRYNKLLKKDKFDPKEILSVTFTNKAADEMRRRIFQVSNVHSPVSWIGTFHGIANKILRKHHNAAGFKRNYTIVDRNKQMSIVKKVYSQSFKFEPEKEAIKRAIAAINHLKECAVRGKHLDKFLKSQGRSGAYLNRYRDLYLAYEKYCREHSLVDFAELILSFYELLCQDLPDLEYLTKDIRSVLVDEFQDTNNLQYKLVCRLCRNRQSIFAVGDDDQLIYSWRGANPNNLKHVADSFPSVKIIRLEQNYRSSQEILDLANALIKNNSNRMPKKLWSEMRCKEDAMLKDKVLQISVDEIMESNMVVRTIIGWQKQKIPLNDIAILYRKSFLARNLENALMQGRIPFRIHGGVRFTEREEVRVALAWLRACLDPSDDYFIQRALRIPVRGIGKATIALIDARAMKNSTGYYKTVVAMSQDKSVAKNIRVSFADFVNLIEEINLMKTAHPRKLLEAIYEKTKLVEYYRNKSSRDIEGSREENLLELLTAADEFVSASPNFKNRTEVKSLKTGNGKTKPSKTGNGKTKPSGTKKIRSEAPDDYDYYNLSMDFIDKTELDKATVENDAMNKENAVQMMTIHAAKGLEFRSVLLCGMEEGVLPHLSNDHGQLSLNMNEDGEEERRLCYVAVTRARENLVLSSVRNRNIHGKYNYSEPSRFINEMFGSE